MSSRMAALSALHRVEHPRSLRTLLSEHFYRPGNDCCDREYSTFDRGYRRLTALAIHRFQNNHSPFDAAKEQIAKDGEANAMLRRKYRAPFVAPEKV